MRPRRAVRSVACCAISVKRVALDLTTSRRACAFAAANLEAIEEGRFDKLPGAAYIPAFLRAYAAHVGLDPEKVMTAYQLSGPVPIKRPVTLPADFPIVEKRAPIGLAVLTVLLVVGAGYAVWHYLPREQAVVAEKVPPVPDRLLASRPRGRVDRRAAVDARTTAAPARRSRKRAPAPPAAPPLPHDRVVAGAAKQAQLAGALAVSTAARRRRRAGAAAAGRDDGARDRPGAGRPAAGTRRTPRAAPVAQPSQSTRRPAADAAAAAQRDACRCRVRHAGSRVRTNSWIELRAPDGDVLAQTYVRAGESYVVPAGIAYRIIDAR